MLVHGHMSTHRNTANANVFFFGKQCFIVIKNSSVTLNAQQKDYLLPGLAFAT